MSVDTVGSLRREFARDNPDPSKIDQLLSQVKLEIITANQLSVSDIIDVYEMGAYLAIKKRDGLTFEKSIYQLENYYFGEANQKKKGNFNSSSTGNSGNNDRKYALLGLYLLYLLTTKGNNAFYLYLARFESDIISNNVFINFAVQLEQALVEGTYNRIEMARSQAPAPEYAWFVDSLMGRIREEVAGCIEEAYDELNEKALGELLFTNDSKLVKEMIERRNWKNQNNMILFPKKTKRHDFGGKIDSELLIKRSIFYSRHLEQII